MTLTIRTDKPESELGLYDGENQIAYEPWQAHRQLAETIHTKLTALLEANNLKLSDISAIIAYKGPGSFTGLRIGLSVANALAMSYQIPIVGTTGDTWIQDGISTLASGKSDQVALPDYGAPVHITQPKK